MLDGWRTRSGWRQRVRAGALAAALVATAAGPAAAQAVADLADVRQRAAEATAGIAVAQDRLRQLDDEAAAAEARAAELREEAAGLEDELEEAAVARFVRSGTSPGMLETDDWIRHLRGQALGRTATEGSGDVLETYRRTLQDLEAVEAELAAARAEQERVLAELRASSEELEAELARLEELQRAEEAQRLGGGGEVRGIGVRLDGPPPEPAAPGQLAVCPVAGPHTFIDSWGFARSGGRRHQGVDMMAATGVPVVAPVAGVVTHRSNRVGGRSFHLEGDDGNRYYGTHLSGYGASGRVAAGEVIGYVGDDGNARGMPHLHFEVHPGGGSPVNPYPYVAAVC